MLSSQKKSVPQEHNFHSLLLIFTVVISQVCWFSQQIPLSSCWIDSRRQQMPAEQSFLGSVCQHTGSGGVCTGLSNACHNTRTKMYLLKPRAYMINRVKPSSHSQTVLIPKPDCLYICLIK